MIRSDKKTSPKRDLLNTSERNITAHLRSSLSEIGFVVDETKYQIDHEYNRIGNEEDIKSLSDECFKCLNKGKNYVVPDIIVHLRGITHSKKNPDANWLVIEVKKIDNFNGNVDILNQKQKKGLERDLKKLNCFKTDQRFQYRHVVSVVLSKNKVWISINKDIEDKKFCELLVIDQKNNS
jgi:hypothetical protein